MTDRFEDLIGGADDLPPEERDRLRRMHELLLEVDAPAEVPAGLREAPAAVEPETPARLRARPWRRVRPAYVLVAAALAMAAFGAGYLLGDRGVASVAVIEMTGDAAGHAVTGSIELLPEDESGNWPMRLMVRGLEPSAGRQDYYELWLTKGGKLAAPCGRFTLHEGQTTVTLSVPYRLRAFDGWVVTRRGSDEPLLSTT